MANDELIAALELAASALDWHIHSGMHIRAAASVRAHIADLKAGGERAKMVAQIAAYIEDYDPTMADAVAERFAASGAHMEANNG